MRKRFLLFLVVSVFLATACAHRLSEEEKEKNWREHNEKVLACYKSQVDSWNLGFKPGRQYCLAARFLGGNYNVVEGIASGSDEITYCQMGHATLVEIIDVDKKFGTIAKVLSSGSGVYLMQKQLDDFPLCGKDFIFVKDTDNEFFWEASKPIRYQARSITEQRNKSKKLQEQADKLRKQQEK